MTIYRPESYSEPLAKDATFGVKFSDDIILLKSFLDQRKIEYDESELEQTPFGRGLRIKKAKK